MFIKSQEVSNQCMRLGAILISAPVGDRVNSAVGNRIIVTHLQSDVLLKKYCQNSNLCSRILRSKNMKKGQYDKLKHNIRVQGLIILSEKCETFDQNL